MKKYFPVFFLFIGLIAAVILVIPSASEDIIRMRWMVFGYFSIITLFFHLGVEQTTKSRPQVFIRYFMAATTIKLLMHLGIIVIFSILNRIIATQFILTFLAMYFLFTIFEVVFVWKRVKIKN
jgi:hypothetical protein